MPSTLKSATNPRGGTLFSKQLIAPGPGNAFGDGIALLSWMTILSLIFGGCCSNVYALEALIKEDSDTGLLITLVQFLITTVFAYPSQARLSRKTPFLVKPTRVPLQRWLPNIALFFATNLLNNMAFGHDISVPVHIILRSGGSIVTMLVGYLWGRRYTGRQISGVIILTLGVVLAALSDSKHKQQLSIMESSSNTKSAVAGFTFLLIAQVLSAIMGIYTSATYSQYGSHWDENLFYSHLLALPLFLPFTSRLTEQIRRLANSRPIVVKILTFNEWFPSVRHSKSRWQGAIDRFLRIRKRSWFEIQIPRHFLFLLLNGLTQYICIRGVNRLGARTSALGVTIVLNLRKLMSLILSIWLFGNRLSSGVLLGATFVFLGVAIYAIPRSSKQTLRSQQKEKRE